MLLAGETLPTGISNIDNGFINDKMNVGIYYNFYDKFVSVNLT